MYEMAFYIPETNTVYSGLFHTLDDAVARVNVLYRDHPSGSGSVVQAGVRTVYQIGY